MNVEQYSIETLTPYPQNNRKHSSEQIQRIAMSIEQFGFNQPIVVDDDNVILVGHARLEAAKSLRLKEVPVLKKKGLSDTQKRAYRILDNKLQNDSIWDVENLGAELKALEAGDFDLLTWGLEDLFPLLPEEEGEVEEDAAHTGGGRRSY